MVNYPLQPPILTNLSGGYIIPCKANHDNGASGL